MRRLLLALLLVYARSGLAADWVIVSEEARAEAGARFEIALIAPGRQLPDEIAVRMTADVTEVVVAMRAVGPAQEGRRAYAATMPISMAGTATLRLADRPSNALVMLVARRDAVLSGRLGADEREPPLSENDPMYFVAGIRGGTTARFQLSFKYRLFDVAAGFGQERPWLSGLYFGYTQNSLWDLSTESKAFRDTSYRPQLFWKWERAGERTFFDGARLGFEHESNGDEGERSRSINIIFVRPEWNWHIPELGKLEFTPKLYAYLDREENPDIHRYRGHIDWRARFDAGGSWIATTVLRRGTAGKGSVLLDLSRRTRDVKFGPVSGYLHMQFFAGYGEDIVDYNLRRKSQLRFGFAIVP